MPRAANSSGNCSIFCSTLRRGREEVQAVKEVQPAVYAFLERRDIKRRGDGNSTAHNVDSRIALFAKPLEQYVAAERDTHLRRRRHAELRSVAVSSPPLGYRRRDRHGLQV